MQTENLIKNVSAKSTTADVFGVSKEKAEEILHILEEKGVSPKEAIEKCPDKGCLLSYYLKTNFALFPEVAQEEYGMLLYLLCGAYTYEIKTLSNYFGL